MAKYDVTHACGHVSTVQLYGPNRTREWHIRKFERELCDACVEERRRQRSEEAAAANVDMGLPVLVGSEKQIAWAETIRHRVMQDLDKFVERYLEGASEELSASYEQRIDILLSQAEARWWIDRRDYSIEHFMDEIRRLIEFGQIRPSVSRKEPEAALEAKAEATVRPAEPRTETVAEIRIIENRIEVEFPEKREDFREIIKFKLRFGWSSSRSAWVRKIGQFAGTTEDRAVETAHRLLGAGFPIRIYDENLRRRAIVGDFEPEIRRWVKKMLEGEYASWFIIDWPREEDFYNVARKLPGSRWDSKNRGVVVPAEQWNEVLDFAERYEFGVSPGACELAEEARRIQEATLVAEVKPREDEPATKPSTTPPVLDVPTEVEVDESLRDDD